MGTNSFHLVVASIERSTGRFTVLDREKEIVRLGSGSRDMKYLGERAMNRAIQTLQRFRSLANAFGAPVRAVATSAVREALNQELFVHRVKAETGITVEVISGAEEARLIYLGVLQSLPVYNSNVLLIDIGGGSTEFLTGRRGRVRYANSLKLGAVRLTERFFPNGETTRKQIAECRKFIRGALDPVIRAVRASGYDTVVGTSGTISTLAEMVRARFVDLPDYRINNFTFTRKQLSATAEEIYDARDAGDRLALDGIDPARADIITAGALILDEIVSELKLKEITVSDYALREGLLLDTGFGRTQHTNLRHLDDLRYRSVIHLAETFHYEPGHAKQVAKLAESIFDQTQSLHELGDAESEFLEAAAILHEIGFFISHDQHHRHSYYLIRNSELPGFTETEKEIVANIARYHRKSHPKAKHDGFARLLPQDQHRVRVLASILRLADGFDRSHHQRIRNVTVRIRGNSVSITALRKRPSDIVDLWGVEQKKSLFEEVFGVRISVRSR